MPAGNAWWCCITPPRARGRICPAPSKDCRHALSAASPFAPSERQCAPGPAPGPRLRHSGQGCAHACKPDGWQRGACPALPRWCRIIFAMTQDTPTPQRRYVRVLSIAGSDSGGGAGIQADLKTFGALGCYGMTAITAITAQNTQGVVAVEGIAPAMVLAQIKAVVEDIGVDAVKDGMLHSPALVEVVAQAIDRFALPRVVLDPVMVATSGDRLLE